MIIDMYMKHISKYAFLPVFGLLLAAGCNGGSEVSPDRSMDSTIDSVSYGIGYFNGQSLNNQGMTDLETDAFMAGLIDGMGGEESLFSDQEWRVLINRYQQVTQQRLEMEKLEEGEANSKEGEEFLAENREKEGVTETESGLQYEVIEEGTGASPGLTDTVRVHYRGTLLDGTEFDNSRNRGGPVTFQLDGVISGWTEGVSLMQEGATYRFWIPPNLAYGQNPPQGSQIGVNSTLVFEVELLEVNPEMEE